MSVRFLTNDQIRRIRPKAGLELAAIDRGGVPACIWSQAPRDRIGIGPRMHTKARRSPLVTGFGFVLNSLWSITKTTTKYKRLQYVISCRLFCRVAVREDHLLDSSQDASVEWGAHGG